MARKLLALPLAMCLAMLLTFGTWAQEPPGNQQVPSSPVRDFALLAVGLLGGWGGAFITGLWSSKNVDKRLDHEAEENRLSREEQRQQLATQLTMQQQMLRDQLEQRTREYMRDYRQQRVDELFQMIVAYDTAVDQYHMQLMADKPGRSSRPGVEPRLSWAVVFLGGTQLGQTAAELARMYDTMLDAMEQDPSAVTEKDRQKINDKASELAMLAERYIASG